MCSAKGHVRSTPESGHVRCTSPCLLSAKSGHSPIHPCQTALRNVVVSNSVLGIFKSAKRSHVIELAIPAGGIFVAQLSLKYLAGFFARQHVPKFDHVVRKAPHAAVWSVWAVLESIPPGKSLEGLLRKRRQAGSIPAVKLGLKNAGENAMPSADARTETICTSGGRSRRNKKSSALAGIDQFRFPGRRFRSRIFVAHL